MEFRRSKRKNKGVAPERFGHCVVPTPSNIQHLNEDDAVEFLPENVAVAVNIPQSTITIQNAGNEEAPSRARSNSSRANSDTTCQSYRTWCGPSTQPLDVRSSIPKRADTELGHSRMVIGRNGFQVHSERDIDEASSVSRQNPRRTPDLDNLKARQHLKNLEIQLQEEEILLHEKRIKNINRQKEIAQLQLNNEERRTFRREFGSTISTKNPNQSKSQTEELTDVFKAILSSIQSRNDDNHAEFRRNAVLKDLPIFDGRIEDWPNFYNQYQQTNKECKFTNQENLSRLQKCLKGDAREAVLSLFVSSENVPEILDCLKLNFGRPEYIVVNLIEKAKQFPKLADNDANGFIKFSNCLRNIVATMESLRCFGHMNNPQLLSEFTSRLPSYLKFSWGDIIRQNEGNVTLRDLANWTIDVAKTYSYICVPEMKIEKEVKSDNKRNKFQQRKKETVLVTQKKISCKICDDDHELARCEDFLKMDADDRWEFVKKIPLCFSCLKFGHSIKYCFMKKKCQVDDCTKRHHFLLHNNFQGNSNIKDEYVQFKESCANTFNGQNQTLLRFLPVVLKSKERKITTYALLDPGSTVTLLDAGVAAALKLSGPISSLCIQWADGVENEEQDSETVSLSISGTQPGAKECHLKNVKTIRNMSLLTQSLDKKSIQDKWPYLRRIDFEGYKNIQPIMIIGEDNPILNSTREVIHGDADGPIASRTILGWVVSGNLKPSTNKSVVYHICSQEDSLQELVKRSFTTEDFGVKISETRSSKEDERALMIMQRTTKKQDDQNRWQTGLLWRNDYDNFPESKSNAERRLRCTERKLDKNPEIKKLYDEKIKHYITNGYLTKIDEEDLMNKSRIWYLPHFPIFNINKPGKIRIVFDAAAKSNGFCLNDFLMKGPDLLKPLPSVLFKFRQRKVAFTADIKEMFHQILIRDADKSSQLILWRGDDRSKSADIFQMNVMIFGSTCSPSSANYVKNENGKTFMHQYPTAAKAIIDKHYVDDYLDCTNTEEEAAELIAQVIHIHRMGGFHIHEWICTSKNVMLTIPEELRSQKLNLQNMDLTQTQRTLGVFWNPASDTFTFKTSFSKVNPKIMDGTKRPTKREVLQILMSVYDPLGFISHFLVKGKILLQKIWRSGINWDDELTSILNDDWISWLEQLKSIQEVRIERCYSEHLHRASSIELNVFCDASEMAFAAVAYLRICHDNKIYIAFVAAKTRVSPLKPLSIPRLELQAAVMGTRLAQVIKEEHEFEIPHVNYWTDSKTVLSWVRSDARNFKQFVGHRIGEILESTSPNDWNWIPTNFNVADLATRSGGVSDFEPDSIWFTGPEFLHKSQNEWPNWEDTAEQFELNDDDERKNNCFLIQANESITPLVNISRFSSWLKLVRCIGWVLRFIKNCRQESCLREKAELTIEEMEGSELILNRMHQRKVFQEEVKKLENDLPINKRSKLYRLLVFLDQNRLIRITGRIEAAQDLNASTKNPIVLDKKDRYVELLIQHYHERLNHQGLECTINEIRQKYWIFGMKSAMKKIKFTCQWCKVKKIKPNNTLMGQLPRERLTSRIRPFTFTGMDFFGPFNVKIGRRIEKRYGVLFTCLTVRAIHLEIASTLNTDSCIMSIRKFISRRGCPVEIFSDNGTNLRGAEREIRTCLEELNNSEIIRWTSIHNIKWKFIPPGTPHMGGCWERLVRSVKSILLVTLKQRNPPEEVLQTLFCEAEHIVNSRPLTEVSIDPEEMEALTPNHFLLGTSSNIQATGIFDDRDLDLRKQWKISQRFVDQFWERFVKEYIPRLLNRTKWFEKIQNLKNDDIVVIVDSSLPRNSWPLGKVIASYPGKDGQIRIVDVKTKNGIFQRPTNKICLIERSIDMDVNTRREDVAAK